MRKPLTAFKKALSFMLSGLLCAAGIVPLGQVAEAADEAAQEIVQDFESFTGIPGGFEIYEAAGAADPYVLEGSHSLYRKAQSGTQFMFLFNEDFPALEVGNEYRMTWWYRVDLDSKMNDGVAYDGVTVRQNTMRGPWNYDNSSNISTGGAGSEASTQWKQASVTFTAAQKWVSFSVYGNVDLYIDKVEIVSLKPVTVSFNGNNGAQVAPIQGVPGSELTLPTPTADLSGWRFDGWYLDAALTTPYTLNVFPNTDTVLYAKWKSDNVILQDFESFTGIPGGFEIYEATGAADPYVLEGGHSLYRKAQSGTQFMFLFNEDFPELEVGKEYRMTWWYRVDLDSKMNDDVAYDGVTVRQNTVRGPWNYDNSSNISTGGAGSEASTQWKQASVTFTAAQKWVSFSVHGNLDLYIDKVEIARMNPVSVFFESNNGTQIDSTQGLPGSAMELPTPTSVSTDWAFDGWYTDVALTNAYTAAVYPNDHTTLYAKWKDTRVPTTAADLYDPDAWHDGAIQSTNTTPCLTDDTWATHVRVTGDALPAGSGAAQGLKLWGNAYVGFATKLNLKADTEYVISFDYYGEPTYNNAVLHNVGAIEYNKDLSWSSLLNGSWAVFNNKDLLFSSTYFGTDYDNGNVTRLTEAKENRWNHFEARFNSGAITELLFYISVGTNSTIRTAYLTNFQLTAGDLNTGIGAAIRMKTENRRQGLRVKNTVSYEMLEAYDIVEFGAIAVRNNRTGTEPITVDSENVARGVAYSKAENKEILWADDGKTKTFSTVLVGITEANYGERYAVRAYAFDGENYYYGKEVRLSVFDMVYAILSDRRNSADVEAAYAVLNSSLTSAQAYRTWEPKNAFLADNSGMERADYDYAFALVGDTQTTTCYYADDLHYTYDWIIDHQVDKKIEYVIGLGDITNWNQPREYQAATSQLDRLTEAGIPQMIIRGNHDHILEYNRYISAEKYKTQDMETFDGTMRDTYRIQTIGHVKYMMLTLDCSPTAEELEWANQAVAAHPDCNVIVSTHVYLNSDNTTTHYASASDHTPAAVKPKDSAKSGQEIFDAFIKKHANIVMVLCGHDFVNGPIYHTVLGENGNSIIELMVDAQQLEVNYSRSLGMIALLGFSNGGKTVTVEYFSTALGAYYGEKYQFTLELNTVS